jgi:hypothetical protein
MKKIENLLLLPFLFAVYGIFAFSPSILSIIFKGTYHVFGPATLSKYLLFNVVVLFILYKLIRWRRQSVNNIWAISHITITFLLIVLMWWSFAFSKWPESFFDIMQPYDVEFWISENRTMFFSALIFMVVQFVFFIYFIVQLVKKPAAASQ